MPARAIGEGRYALVQHDDHSHLTYALELPETPKQIQKDLRVEDEGSYVITIRNPETLTQMTDEKPDFPKEIVDEFGHRKFSRQIEPKMLDYEHAEFILVGAGESPDEELGVKLDAEKERLSQSDLVKDLKLEKGSKRLKPVEEGKWD